ncbi:MAG TPA: TetR/AcrR family transcriptional regulator [Synergistales bacterium]|nr:TetR/AcrR family transcriptional regulator [Synergistales bacterium]
MRSRSRKLDEEKRRNLMDAAIEEIAANGIEGASYNRIIERSGLSKGVVYYYFENKESLYKTVLEEVERQFIAAVGTLRIPDDKDAFWDVCDMHYTKALKFAASNLRIVDVARSFIEPACSPSMDKGPVFESLQRAERWTRCVLRKGQELGALRQDVDFELLRNVVQAVGYTMDSWLFDKLRSEPDAVDIERFVSFALDMFKRILSPKGLGESC